MFLKIIMIVLLSTSLSAKADLFGGDVIVLTKILANSLQQISQLRSIVKEGKEHLSIVKDIHRGINDSLNMAKTVKKQIHPGLYQSWNNKTSAIKQLEAIYGAVETETTETQIQRDTDRGIIEAITLNNELYQYAKEIDSLGEDIKQASHTVSPGGAQKLTAQALGVMLHVMNASLRAQSKGLKIQAQSLAIQNRKDKERTFHDKSVIQAIQNEIKLKKASFRLPRFH